MLVLTLIDLHAVQKIRSLPQVDSSLLVENGGREKPPK